MVVLLIGKMLDVDADVDCWVVIFWPSFWVMVGPAMFNDVYMGCVIAILVIGILVDVIYCMVFCFGMVWITNYMMEDGFFWGWGH